MLVFSPTPSNMSPSTAAKSHWLFLVFQCQICKTIVSPRTKATRIVVSTRVARYPYRVKAKRVAFINHAGRRNVRLVDDPGGTGCEIVREVVACPVCARRR